MRIAYFIIFGGIAMIFLSKYRPINLGQAIGLLWIAIGWLAVIIIEELRRRM